MDGNEQDQWLATLKEKVGDSDKNWWTTLVLSFFFGMLGADRFYLGYVGVGFVKLFTFGALGFWYFLDIILLLCNGMRDAYGGLVRRPF